MVSALVLLYIPPFTERELSGRMSALLLLIGVGSAVFGVVCLVKHPTTGSPVGSERYGELIARERYARFRSLRNRFASALIGATVIFGALLFRRVGGEAWDTVDGITVATGVALVVLGAGGLIVLFAGAFPNVPRPPRGREHS